MRHYIAVAIAISLFAVPWLATNFPTQADYLAHVIQNAGNQVAAVIGRNTRTIAQLQTKYTSPKKRVAAPIRILLVPGHEPHYGGAEIGSLKERDLAVALTKELAALLEQNDKYEVIVTRDADSWNPVFASYFDTNWDSINEWYTLYKAESLRQLSKSTSLTPPPVYHNNAPQNVATRLYGLIKWSNENNIDIVLHVHFNDYPTRRSKEGKYSGISIYTPETLYANGTTTRAITDAIFKRLQKYNPISDFPGESTGIVDERELIAIGAYNTADSASLLIEYGYLYEPQFMNSVLTGIALKDLALQTYLGIEDFLNSKNLMQADTVVLPYTWTGPIEEDNEVSMDVYALQTAFMVEDIYPPAGKSKNECPRTGKMGQCTIAALKAFQKKYGISEKWVGEKTIEKLNQLYSISN